MSTVDVNYTDMNSGSHTYISQLLIEMPVELDIFRGETDTIEIGSIPPLYSEETSFLPSYHRVKFTIEQNINSDEY